MLWKKPHFVAQILELGIRPDTSFLEVQKTKMFNLFLLLATPFAFITFLINFFSHNYLPALLNLVQLAVFAVVFLISYSQKHLYLRSASLLVLAAVGIISAYYFKNGSEYRLLIMVVAAVVIFDKNWQYLSFAFLVSCAFLFVRLDEAPLHQMQNAAIAEMVIKIVIPLFIFVMCLFYFKYIYFKNLIHLEKAYNELSLAQDQKERILNSVAHDLRSPISNIASISKMMLADNRLEKEQNELLKLIEYSSDSSLYLINELLQNNNIILQPYLVNEVNMNPLIFQWLQSIRFRANEKKIRIETDITSQILMVAVDAEKTERVFTNLVNNAIKFSPENSVITITLSREDANALLIVKDEGIGIPKENHQRIFDTFTNAKRSGTAGEKSFGLGLSICKQIIEQQKGTISLESVVGHGSSFFVRFPLVTK
jgi:signal transduction histidine kinase